MPQGSEHSDEAPDALNQQSYKETPYEDATWEIVGQFTAEEDFAPLEFAVLQGAAASIDPMFADYGGRAKSDATRRWHLPEELAYQAPQSREQQEEVVDERIKIEPQELERRLAEAEARGRLTGLEEAISENLERMRSHEDHLANLVGDLDAHFRERLAVVEKEALELTLAISRKIISHAVEINPEYIIQIVQEALRHGGGAKIKKIRISAQDMEFVEVIGIDKRIKEFDGTWQFEKDDTIKSGCIVETSAGEIDYQLDRAWERVQDNVLKVIR